MLLCLFQDAKLNLNWDADVCTCLSPSLTSIWRYVDWLSFVLVLLSQSPLLCQLLEESRPLLETCKVKDSMVVEGNKQVNTPDTDTSLELIKDLREYFGSSMPRYKWYKEKGALIYRQPTFMIGMNIFYCLWVNILFRFCYTPQLSNTIFILYVQFVIISYCSVICAPAFMCLCRQKSRL